jgi:hypothetical protein
MDKLHELLTGEHMPENYYVYLNLLKNNMILEENVPVEILAYKKLLGD